MSDEIAIGTQVFKRTKRLETLLESVSPFVETVYVAENGDISDRIHLYERNYSFDLRVLDLEYDAGLATSRNRIVEESTEEYICIVDSDHTLPANIDVLRDILRANSELGGVSGALLNFYDGATELEITGNFLEINGTVITRSPFEKEPDIQKVDGYDVILFDFIANAAMFRRECLEEYGWDDYYTIGYEHLDFYLTYKELTDWKFGVCPSVVFGHRPGGSGEYESNRHSEQKLTDSKQYFESKWGAEEKRRGMFAWVLGPNKYGVLAAPKWKRALVILLCRGPRDLAQKVVEEVQ